MNSLKSLIKKSKFLYGIYYWMMSLIVNIIKLFTQTDDRIILFVCYGGLHYADSPKIIYEAMLRDSRFADYKLIWAFSSPEKFDVKNKVKIDTFNYYKIALKARCWITNVMVERALNFKGKRTFYFYTGHGTPLKFVGIDVKNNNGSFASQSRFRYDFAVCQSEYERGLISRAFQIPKDNISISGVPRNDILCNFTEIERKKIRADLKIGDDKIAILYAPTFRDLRGEKKEIFDINIAKWKEKLQNKYVLLYRAHPNIVVSQKQDDGFFVDVTKYSSVENLMIASDVLISDYSSIIFDYSITHKPIYLYLYDYEEYHNTRGLYFDIKKELPFAINEDELLDKIIHDYCECDKAQLEIFQKKYASECGNATSQCLDIIFSNINGGV